MRLFLDITNHLVIDIKVLSVVEVTLIIFEVMDPVLEIRDDLPTAFPEFAVHPPGRILVQQDQVHLIVVFVVFHADS